MIVEFDRSFSKSLSKIKDNPSLKKIEKLILEVEKSKKLSSISNLKKLTGYKTYYRIRMGNYRVGIESISSKTIRFIIIAHRKDIYRRFP